MCGIGIKTKTIPIYFSELKLKGFSIKVRIGQNWFNTYFLER
jgi:hypothetical protein